MMINIIIIIMICSSLDSLRGSSVNIGAIQRRLAWPLRKDDTHNSRSVNNYCNRPGGRGKSGPRGPQVGNPKVPSTQ